MSGCSRCDVQRWGMTTLMLGRIRAIVARKLDREGALVVAGLVSIGGVIVLLTNVVAAMHVRAPGESFVAALGAEGFVLMAAELALFCGLPAVFALTRGGWIAQGAVREAVRQERRARSLRADPESAYGLPGFPEVGAGSGDLTAVDQGGLTEPSFEVPGSPSRH